MYRSKINYTKKEIFSKEDICKWLTAGTNYPLWIYTNLPDYILIKEIRKKGIHINIYAPGKFTIN